MGDGYSRGLPFFGPIERDEPDPHKGYWCCGAYVSGDQHQCRTCETDWNRVFLDGQKAVARECRRCRTRIPIVPGPYWSEGYCSPCSERDRERKRVNGILREWTNADRHEAVVLLEAFSAKSTNRRLVARARKILGVR